VELIMEEWRAKGDNLLFEERLRDIRDRFSNLFSQDVGIGLMRGLRAREADICI